MSTLVTKYIQLGTDSTVSKNYVISTPVSPDGSLRISNGVVGNATDVMVIKPTTIQFSQNIGIGKAPTSPLDINGEIKATSFSGGTFSGGTFSGGTFSGGTFSGGTFSGSFSGDGSALTNLPITFASYAENKEGTVENKAVDPLGIREAFNASGSAPVFACRAWVNFKSIGNVEIRASGNVSSITYNLTGDYMVNFMNGMPDANYVVVALCGGPHSSQGMYGYVAPNGPTASSYAYQLTTKTLGGSAINSTYVYAAFFR